MNPEEPILDTDFDNYLPPPRVRRHSAAHAARRNVRELGLEQVDGTLDDSWSLDDFSDLLPDHY
jgi:hypothetical protein